MRTNSLLRHGSVYALGDVAERAIGLAMLPVYAYTLSPAGFGLLALVQVLTGLGSAVLGLGLYQTITRYFYNPPAGRSGLHIISTAWPVLMTLPLAVLLVLGLAGGEKLFGLVLGSLDFVTLVVPALVIIYLEVAFIELALAVARTRLQARAYVTIMVTRAAITAVLSCVVLIAFDAGAVGVVLGQVAATLATAIACAVWLRRTARPSLDARLARTLLVFGAPLIPQNTSFWALRLQDRLILDRLTGPGIVGVYSMAFKFTLPLHAVLDSAFRVIQPTLSAAAENEGQRSSARSFVLQYVVGGFSLTLVSLLVGPPLAEWILPPAYDASADALPVLLVAVLYMGVFRLATGASVFFGGQTRTPLVLTVLGVMMNAALNVLLIPSYGLSGAAFAAAGTFGVLACVAWVAGSMRALLTGMNRSLGWFSVVGSALLLTLCVLGARGDDMILLVAGGGATFGYALTGARWIRVATGENS